MQNPNSSQPWWSYTDAYSRRIRRLQGQQVAQQQTGQAQAQAQLPAAPIAQAAQAPVSENPQYLDMVNQVQAQGQPQIPWASQPVQPSAAQAGIRRTPSGVPAPEDRPPLPQWIGDIANTVWGAARTIAPSQPVTQDPNGGRRAMQDLWQGEAPSFFAPEDTWLGKQERNYGRAIINPLLKAQQGATLPETWAASAESTAGNMAISDVGPAIKQAWEKPTPENVASAAFATLFGLGMPLAPKGIGDLLNLAPQAVETAAGVGQGLFPDTVKIGDVEIPNLINLGGAKMFGALSKVITDPGPTWATIKEGIDSGSPAKASSAYLRAFGMGTEQSVMDRLRRKQQELGADYSLPQRDPNRKKLLSDPAGFIEGTLLNDPVTYAYYRTAPIAFSGPDARARAAERILAGEDAETATRGAFTPAPSEQLFSDETAAFEKRIQDRIASAARLAEADAIAGGANFQQAQQAAAEAADEQERVFGAIGMIKGEALPMAEMIGQTVIGTGLALAGVDPMNKLPLGKLFGIEKFLPKTTTNYFVTKVYDALAKDASGATDLEKVQAARSGVTVGMLRAKEKAAIDLLKTPDRKTAAKAAVVAELETQRALSAQAKKVEWTPEETALLDKQKQLAKLDAERAQLSEEILADRPKIAAIDAQRQPLMEALPKLQNALDDTGKPVIQYDQFNAKQIEARKQAELDTRIKVLEERAAKFGDVSRTTPLVSQAVAQAYSMFMDLAELLPQAKARSAAGYAVDVMHTLTKDLSNVAEAATNIQLFIDNPKALAERGFGNLGQSVKAELARPVIEAMGMEKFTKALKKVGEEGKYNPIALFDAIANQLDQTSKEVFGVKPLNERPIVEKAGTQLKSWLGEFYLRTLGYVFRNVMGDTVTMAMDGVHTMDGAAAIDDYLGKVGVGKEYLMHESQAEGVPSEQIPSKLSKVPVIGPFNNWLGDKNNQWEMSRRTRAFYTTFKRFMGLNWKPKITDQVRMVLGPEFAHIADALEMGYREGLTKAELLKTFNDKVGQASQFSMFNISAALEKSGVPVDAISPQLRAMVYQDLQKALAAGADPNKAIDAVIDGYEDGVIKNYIRHIASLGDTVDPTKATFHVTASDLGEAQVHIETLAKQMVDAGAITPAQAEAQTKQAIQDLQGGELTVAKARTESHGFFQPPADPAQSRDWANRSMSLIQWGMEQEHAIREKARGEQSRLMGWVSAQIEKLGKGTGRGQAMQNIWDDYRRLNNEQNTAKLGEIADIHKKVGEAAKVINDPAAWEQIKKDLAGVDTPTKRAEEAWAQMIEDMKKGNPDAAPFDTKLGEDRARIDAARLEAFRLSRVLTGRDPAIVTQVADILSAAENNVMEHALTARVKMGWLLDRKRAGEIDMAAYDAGSAKIWQDYFDYAERRYGELTHAQLIGTATRNSASFQGVLKTLTTELGYSRREAAEIIKGIVTPEGMKKAEDILANKIKAPKPAPMPAKGDVSQPEMPGMRPEPKPVAPPQPVAAATGEAQALPGMAPPEAAPAGATVKPANAAPTAPPPSLKAQLKTALEAAKKELYRANKAKDTARITAAERKVQLLERQILDAGAVYAPSSDTGVIPPANPGDLPKLDIDPASRPVDENSPLPTPRPASTVPDVPLAYDLTGVDPRRIVHANGPNAETYTFVLDILPADQVAQSHLVGGAKNQLHEQPAWQPRGRDQAAYQAQTEKNAQQFKAPQILTTDQIDSGVPIVHPEKGTKGQYIQLAQNGSRQVVETVRARAPEGVPGKADSITVLNDGMRDMARKAGIPDERIAAAGDKPMVVRILVSKVDPAEFAQLTNKPKAMDSTLGEQATSDAKFVRGNPAVLSSLKIEPGQSIETALQSPKNEALRKAFQDHFTLEERTKLFNDEGAGKPLTDDGEKRMKMALYSAIYGDTPEGKMIGEAIAAGKDLDNSPLEKAIFANLGGTAQLEGLIGEGKKWVDLSLTKDLTDAYRAVNEAMNSSLGKGAKPVAAVNAYLDVTSNGAYADTGVTQFSPEAKALARLIAQRLQRGSGANSLIGFLADYNDMAIGTKMQSDIFGGGALGDQTKQAILNTLFKKYGLDTTVPDPGPQVQTFAKTVEALTPLRETPVAAEAAPVKPAAEPTIEEQARAHADAPITEDALVAQDAELEQNGDHEAPRFADIVKASTLEQSQALNAIRQAAKDHMAQPHNPKELSKAQYDALYADLKRQIGDLNTTIDRAKTYGREATNFALLDYASKRGIDAWMGLLLPFSYWSTRQGRNFALRLLQNPAYLGAYLRYKQALQDENKRRGGRARFDSSIRIPTGDLSGGKLPDVYFDPTETFFPYAGFLERGVEDGEQAKNMGQQLYSLLGKVGLRPSPLIEMPLRYFGAMQADNSPEQQAQWGKGSIGMAIPQTGIIQAATGAAGIGGPMGINIEEPLRRALGLPDTTAYDPYRVSRSVSDMAAAANAKIGPGLDIRPYLAAQEWIRLHAQTDLGMQIRNATAEDVAKELRIDPAIAESALAVAREGAKQATGQRAVTTLAGSMLGLRLQAEPQGEKIRQEMTATEKAAAYNPVTGAGSREDVKTVQAAYPALQAQRQQYYALPGDTREAGYLLDAAQRSTINVAFDRLKDAVIQTRPWDRKSARLVEDARWKAQARISREKPDQKGMDWQADYQKAVAALSGTADGTYTYEPDLNYKPMSVAGANPAEAVKLRQEEIMRHLVRTQPRAESFIGPDGAIDFTAYNASLADWSAVLPTIAHGIPEIGNIVAAADKEGRGPIVRKWLDTLDATAVDVYRKRSDTALEAAQRIYFEGIYTPAFEEYRIKADAGEPDAWAQTVGAVPPIMGKMLAPLIEKVYGARFTPEDMASISRLVFPPAQDVMRSNMSEGAKQKDKARTAFWDFMMTQTPPGSDSYDLNQEPLIGAALDQSSRATLTTEQYLLANQMARGWVQQNIGQVTPEMQAEWAGARQANKDLKALITTTLGDDGAMALSRYQSAQTAAEKLQIRMQNPKVQQALNLTLAYAQKNPLYARYYRGAVKSAKARPVRPRRP